MNQTGGALLTGSYVIIVRVQFLYNSQSEGWALLMYQSLEHVIGVLFMAVRMNSTYEKFRRNKGEQQRIPKILGILGFFG